MKPNPTFQIFMLLPYFLIFSPAFLRRFILSIRLVSQRVAGWYSLQEHQGGILSSPALQAVPVLVLLSFRWNAWICSSFLLPQYDFPVH